ncbi:MAG: type I methionyl aminopeptidase [Chloroflexaceae bacterium]|nr:type I methionyl aminopeptidase [Chloroflexaceae bacterium]
MAIIFLKTPRQIEMLQQAGRIVADTFEVLRGAVKPGVTTDELNRIAEDYIRSRGAEPVYKGYGRIRAKPTQSPRDPFPAAICSSVNDVICHGIPNRKERLRNGDIIGIDIGIRYQGWVGDSCVTFAVGQVSPKVRKLLDVTQRCLELGIEQAHIGNTLGDIGAAIQAYAESHGFSVVEEYTGHGVGRSLHEEPTVGHCGKPNSGRRLMSGMVFTIEPMINMGEGKTRQDKDGWTVRTKDGSLSAQFEHQIAITDNGPRILTLRSQ